jgi:branched-chain amino acid transport system ATP-binding protein
MGRRRYHPLADVPQGRRIFPSLTVEENLRVAARGATAAADGSAWTLDRIYALFPVLRERRGQAGTALSGGEQQMLAIGRALAGNPRMILLDEPTEGLAPIMVERVLAALLEIKRSGQALLLVEQNHRFAAALADEVHVMQSGTLVAHAAGASHEEVAALAERYLGVG